ncbi:hypothetical protein QNI16_14790 [Cytophagaceae bacterium YF14B1]|uniref:Uncharacterized protein n=1 Tax=Xanthocytophaga flava TaxID=3048013 RepID=A0AAE3QRA8_9BACT|nr:hypothetical protein [Xanthocytophaga flavus]MDJ1481765.1 hypothetical protein [Xanthocytophaga flavus]
MTNNTPVKNNRTDRWFYLGCLMFLLSIFGYKCYRSIHVPDEDLQLEKALIEAVKQIEGKSETDSVVIEIFFLTTFEWDSLIIFANHLESVNHRVIQNRVGYKWEGAYAFNGGDMFVFMENKKVVAYVYFEKDYEQKELYVPYYMGFRGSIGGISVYTPDNAVFVVTKYNELG